MPKSILAIIPARGGSKGVLRKNVRSVAGRPLIYWTINSAREANAVTKYIVSSDDDAILDVARSFDAPTIKRPKDLAGDTTPMIPVLQHLCCEAERDRSNFDYVLLLQPTAPMRSSHHIDEAINLLVNQSIHESLVSVYQVIDCHPSRMYHLQNGYLSKFYEEPEGSLRQDLEPVYHRNGAIYMCSRDLLMKSSRLLCDTPIPYIMSKEESINIDDEQDLMIADFILSKKFNHS